MQTGKNGVESKRRAGMKELRRIVCGGRGGRLTREKCPRLVTPIRAVARGNRACFFQEKDIQNRSDAWDFNVSPDIGDEQRSF